MLFPEPVRAQARANLRRHDTPDGRCGARPSHCVPHSHRGAENRQAGFAGSPISGGACRMTRPRRSDRTRGLLFLLAGTVLVAIMDAVVKLLSTFVRHAADRLGAIHDAGDPPVPGGRTT